MWDGRRLVNICLTCTNILLKVPPSLLVLLEVQHKHRIKCQIHVHVCKVRLKMEFQYKTKRFRTFSLEFVIRSTLKNGIKNCNKSKH